MYRCQCRGKGRCSDAAAIDLDWTSVCALNGTNNELFYRMTRDDRLLILTWSQTSLVGIQNGGAKRTTCQWNGTRYCQQIIERHFSPDAFPASLLSHCSSFLSPPSFPLVCRNSIQYTSFNKGSFAFALIITFTLINYLRFCPKRSVVSSRWQLSSCTHGLSIRTLCLINVWALNHVIDRTSLRIWLMRYACDPNKWVDDIDEAMVHGEISQKRFTHHYKA